MRARLWSLWNMLHFIISGSFADILGCISSLSERTSRRFSLAPVTSISIQTDVALGNSVFHISATIKANHLSGELHWIRSTFTAMAPRSAFACEHCLRIVNFIRMNLTRKHSLALCASSLRCEAKLSFSCKSSRAEHKQNDHPSLVSQLSEARPTHSFAHFVAAALPALRGDVSVQINVVNAINRPATRWV